MCGPVERRGRERREAAAFALFWLLMRPYLKGLIASTIA
jgi:hypothetical protein